MDLMTLGLDAALVGGIIGLTETIKYAVPISWHRYILVVPALLGLGAAAAVVSPWTLAGWVVKGISYAGVAAYIYKAGKTTWGK